MLCHGIDMVWQAIGKAGEQEHLSCFYRNQITAQGPAVADFASVSCLPLLQEMHARPSNCVLCRHDQIECMQMGMHSCGMQAGLASGLVGLLSTRVKISINS